jgi:hypothetical protein
LGFLSGWIIANPFMTNFIAFNRDQAFLLPPDLKACLPEDDLAHFVVAAINRMKLGSF